MTAAATPRGSDCRFPYLTLALVGETVADMPRSRRFRAAIKWGAATLAALAICGGQTFEATARVGELGVAPVVTTPPPFIFNSHRPSISGRPIVGNVLSATTGEWSGTEPLSYAFQWQRCTKDACVDVPGE